MKTKAESQTQHFRQRLFERYKMVINESQIKTIVSLIQKGKGKLLEKQSNRVKKYSVPFEDKNIVVIYDSIRKTLVTVLPEN